MLGEIRERLVEVLADMHPTGGAPEVPRAVLRRSHRRETHGTVARDDHDRTPSRLANELRESRQSLSDRYSSHTSCHSTASPEVRESSHARVDGNGERLP